MKFIMENEIKKLGINFIGVEIRGLVNKKESKDFEQEKIKRVKNFLNNIDENTIFEDDILKGYLKLHEKVGVSKRKNTPASENLIKLLLKNKQLFTVNLAVDIYNLISIESKIALGAHNIDNITGNINFRLTDGTEKFIPLGQTENKSVNKGEYAYIDDSNEILCRLEIRQVEKTKVTEETTNIFYIVQGNEFVSHELLLETANKLIEDTTKYCGGIGKIIYDSEIN